MTTTLLLVRHAAHDWLGRGLAGRLAGVGLNAQGRQQAQDLVGRLQGAELHALYASPQPRTQETAAPLAAARGLTVEVEAAFDEIDFGDWTGLRFEELHAQGEAWRQWVERRGSACPPGGEPFAAACERAMKGLHRIAADHRGQGVCVVSHGDVIKGVIAQVLGLSLDHLERLEIAPCSVSIVVAGGGWSQLRLLNAQEALPAAPR